MPAIHAPESTLTLVVATPKATLTLLFLTLRLHCSFLHYSYTALSYTTALFTLLLHCSFLHYSYTALSYTTLTLLFLTLPARGWQRPHNFWKFEGPVLNCRGSTDQYVNESVIHEIRKNAYAIFQRFLFSCCKIEVLRVLKIT